MKQIMTLFFIFIAFAICTASCYKTEAEPSAENNENNSADTTAHPNTNKMKITVGTVVFSATLNENGTVTAFKAMLPMTINMSELNANEKFFYLSSTLPTNAAPGGRIQAGDLMRHRTALMPPSTFNTCPVTHLLSAESR